MKKETQDANKIITSYEELVELLKRTKKKILFHYTFEYPFELES